MQIYGPFRLSTTQAASATGKTNPAASRLNTPGTSQPTSSTPVDQLDLSSAATSPAGSVNRLGASSAIVGGGEIRVDRVADIRRQIASGSYETPEKLDAALDRFLDDYA